MKRIALIAALAAALFAGCGGDDDDPPATTLSSEGDPALLTSDGLSEAIDAVSDDAGDDELLQVQLSERGAIFRLIAADGGASSLLYTGGDVIEQELEVAGAPSIAENAFAFDEVDPAAVDAISQGVAEQAGEGSELTGLSLEYVEEAGAVEWTIGARSSDGSEGIYTAGLDGSNVQPAPEERG